MRKPTAISLFSGAGGLDIGFQKAGFDVKVAIELDPSCCKTLEANFRETRVVNADVSQLSGGEICELAGLDIGDVDCLFGGPPCQSFSLAGNRRGLDDPRGQLVSHFIRLVREIAPKSFVMENVKGMVNWQDGIVLETIMNELIEPVDLNGEKLQYQADYQVLDAAGFGVPQRRERIFVVGNRLGKRMLFPISTHAKLGPVASIRLKPLTTVGETLGKLPPADEPSETAIRISETIKARRVRHGY